MDWVRKFVEPVDMTEGTPWKKIVLFAVPMLVGNVAQQLYNTVDSVVVGQFVGYKNSISFIICRSIRKTSGLNQCIMRAAEKRSLTQRSFLL